MDDYRHQGLRKRLVEVLKSKGISDAEVLAAVNSIPRHFFIDDTAFMELAYQDGTGSGYQTAVLVHLGAKVFSIERHRPLYMLTKDRLMGMNLRANLYHGDGYKGLEREAPFDRILVTCGAPYIPLDLQHQLKVGGRLVIPVGEGEEQRMLCVERLSDVDFATKDLGSFRFVPMLQDKA